MSNCLFTETKPLIKLPIYSTQLEQIPLRYVGPTVNDTYLINIYKQSAIIAPKIDCDKLVTGRSRKNSENSSYDIFELKEFCRLYNIKNVQSKEEMVKELKNLLCNK